MSTCVDAVGDRRELVGDQRLELGRAAARRGWTAAPSPARGCSLRRTPTARSPAAGAIESTAKKEMPALATLSRSLRTCRPARRSIARHARNGMGRVTPRHSPDRQVPASPARTRAPLAFSPRTVHAHAFPLATDWRPSAGPPRRDVWGLRWRRGLCPGSGWASVTGPDGRERDARARDHAERGRRGRRAHRAAPVASVRLRVGRLSGVVPDAMLFCFELATAGTPLEGATLEIERPEAGRAAAPAERSFALRRPVLLCGCGSADVEVRRRRRAVVTSVVRGGRVALSMCATCGCGEADVRVDGRGRAARRDPHDHEHGTRTARSRRRCVADRGARAGQERPARRAQPRLARRARHRRAQPDELARARARPRCSSAPSPSLAAAARSA